MKPSSLVFVFLVLELVCGDGMPFSLFSFLFVVYFYICYLFRVCRHFWISFITLSWDSNAPPVLCTLNNIHSKSCARYYLKIVFLPHKIKAWVSSHSVDIDRKYAAQSLDKKKEHILTETVSSGAEQELSKTISARAYPRTAVWFRSSQDCSTPFHISFPPRCTEIRCLAGQVSGFYKEISVLLSNFGSEYQILLIGQVRSRLKCFA